MGKILKIVLKIAGGLLALIIILAIGGWIYFKFTFMDFESDYAENKEVEQVTINGHSFADRNGNGQLDTYEDDRLTLDVRVEDLLTRMTIEEKIHLLKGSGIASAMGQDDPQSGIPGAAGMISPTPRLGLPTVYLSDGPAGLRIEPTREGQDRTYYATAFPIGTLLASTWDTDLVEQVGTAMGNEALEYGIDVLLGPGANIHRHPLCGRNFEYYSEDPVLTGYIGAAMVNGIESNGVGASVKHFVANNQETNRNNNDVIVSDRAMREIYLKAFEIIVKESQPWTIMSSYNKVNGTYTSESRELLTDILRNDWGYEGVVVSDWFGGNDAPAQINAGNDLLEPGTKLQWEALSEAHENGELTIENIDTSVRRILRLVLNSRKMNDYQYSESPDLKKHALITRKSASEGMVLLENEDVLPLKPGADVALLGVTSFDMITGGTGSGDVNEAYIVSLEEGLSNVGLKVNSTSKKVFEEFRDANRDEFVRPEGLYAMLTPYDPPELPYSREQLVKIASESDVAIFTIGRNSGEGGDRVEKDDFLLTSEEKELLGTINEVFHDAGKKVIVVLNIGGVIETASWKGLSDAILLAWQGGQENGNSIADILVGKVNPSGKLPMTFPVNLDDHASNANFPLDGKPLSLMNFISSGKEKEEKVRNEDFTNYEEGIYVGYRHFDKSGLQVSYPFGFGLSYTDFVYNDPNVILENDSIYIEVSVQNVGEIPGKEVVQVYVSPGTTATDRPVQELKAFTKTGLIEAGEVETVLLTIPVSQLRYWDEDESTWILENGTYKINVGSSSRNIRITREVDI